MENSCIQYAILDEITVYSMQSSTDLLNNSTETLLNNSTV